MHQLPDTQAAAIWIRAQWHRAQSRDFLNNSTASMHQHEKDADRLEEQARAMTRAAMHDPHQAAEAEAFTLAHTNNQPRTTGAQTNLF